MNILFITHYSFLYGANRSLLLLLKGLKEKKINLMVIVPRSGPFLTELDKLNIPYRKIKFWSWMGVRDNLFFLKSFLRFSFNILILPVLVFNVLRFKPSAIYTNSSTTPVGIYLSFLLKVPHIWHIRELGKEDYNLDYDFGKKYFYSVMRKSNAIVCISKFVKEKIFPGDWKNISVINNAIYSSDDDEQIPSGRLNKWDTSFIFLMMNLILPSKGIEDAIEALAKLKTELKNVKLIICGDDEDMQYRKYLDDLIIKLNLNENVFFRGFVENSADMYRNSDAVIVCSRNEAWGRVAAEAMFHQKPVIGFNSGGTKEIITDRVNGFLYNNINELVDCMKTVILQNELTSRIKNSAREFALKRFSNKDYTDQIYEVISKLINKN